MALNWNDDDEEELTEIDYKKKPSRVLVHEEITSPLPEEHPSQKTKEPAVYSPLPPPRYAPKPTPMPPFSQPAVGSYTPASLRDRFVAFLIDALIGAELYFVLGYLLLRFFQLPNLPALHHTKIGLWLHVLGTIAGILLYYVFLEASIGATVGKIFCRLRVVEENGQKASVGNVLIRNLLRLIDYPFLFLVAIITMESSPWHQRLGDRAAKTVVIKKSRRHLPAVDLMHTPLGSTLSRIFAEGMDLCLSLPFLYGYLLLMSPQRPYLAWIMYLHIPVVFIFYYTLLEFFTGTTPGKAVFKRQVILENGEPLDFSSSFLRNLFRPLDYFLGYLLMTVSKKKQRLGDMAAETLVIAKGAGKRGGMAILLAVVSTTIMVYCGFHNQNNFIRQDYGLSPAQGWRIFIPSLRSQKNLQQKRVNTVPITRNGKTIIPNSKPATPVSTTPPFQGKTSPGNKLKLEEFYFATGPQPGQIRYDAIFKKGDLLFAFFKIRGYHLDSEQKTHLSEDLQVESPKGEWIITEKNVVNFNKKMENSSQSVLFGNQLKIPKDSPEGKYRAVFVVHDEIAKTDYVFEKSFEIQ